MYIFNLPDYKGLEETFAKQGYTIDIDLANELIIEKDGEPIGYDELPENLQKELTIFANDNDIN